MNKMNEFIGKYIEVTTEFVRYLSQMFDAGICVAINGGDLMVYVVSNKKKYSFCIPSTDVHQSKNIVELIDRHYTEWLTITDSELKNE